MIQKLIKRAEKAEDKIAQLTEDLRASENLSAERNAWGLRYLNDRDYWHVCAEKAENACAQLTEELTRLKGRMENGDVAWRERALYIESSLTTRVQTAEAALAELSTEFKFEMEVTSQLTIERDEARAALAELKDVREVLEALKARRIADIVITDDTTFKDVPRFSCLLDAATDGIGPTPLAAISAAWAKVKR